MFKRKWNNPTNTPTYNSWRSMRNRVLFVNSCSSHNFYNEFSTRHNLGHDTISCLNAVTDAMVGRRLTYKDLKEVA
jgi:hypothetical protein